MIKIDDSTEIQKIIKSLRESDIYIPEIFMLGGCYKFHLFLKTIWPHAKPYINDSKDHIATMISGTLFDINGVIEENQRYKFEPIQDSEIDMVKEWSFSRTHVLQLRECPYCEEPIIFEND